jgi:hypothetical protein
MHAKTVFGALRGLEVCVEFSIQSYNIFFLSYFSNNWRLWRGGGLNGTKDGYLNLNREQFFLFIANLWCLDDIISYIIEMSLYTTRYY